MVQHAVVHWLRPVCSIVLLGGVPLFAQSSPSPVQPATQAGPVSIQSAQSAVAAIQSAQSAATTVSADSQPLRLSSPERVPGYVLGAEDQIIIRAFQAEEISDKPIEIAGDGYINLPLVGRVQAAGLTVVQLETELVARLSEYLEHPQVTILVSDYRSEPVSVIGSVKNPGVIQLKGRKTLVEVIALAGGLLPDAGNTAIITRDAANGPAPLPNAVPDPGGKTFVARLNLRNVMDSKAPQDNIVVQANDVITVPRAQMVYVVGEVAKPGGYILNERDSVSILQILSLAGGMTPNAAATKAEILRDAPDGNAKRVEVASDLRKILAGRAPDVTLHPDDILFVPNSLAKSAGKTALQTALNLVGFAVWRIP